MVIELSVARVGRTPSDPGPSPHGKTRGVLRDLGPGILLWEFILYEEKKLYRAGRKGRRSRADHLVPRSRSVARMRPRILNMHELIYR